MANTTPRKRPHQTSTPVVGPSDGAPIAGKSDAGPIPVPIALPILQPIPASPSAGPSAAASPAAVEPPATVSPSDIATGILDPQPLATAPGSAAAPLSAAEVAALSLPPDQCTALQKMLTGSTLNAAAQAAGVTRMTLYRWMNQDPNFQAAYNAWQQDALVNARTRLLTLADRAVSTVGGAIEHDARLAFSLLKTLGTLDRPTPGSTDPKEIEQRTALARFKSESELSDELFRATVFPGTAGKPSAKQLIEVMERLNREAQD